jgi:hypothetical protein
MLLPFSNFYYKKRNKIKSYSGTFASILKIVTLLKGHSQDNNFEVEIFTINDRLGPN